MGAIEDVGRDEERLKLVFCFSARDKTRELDLGEQRVRIRSLDSLPHFLTGVISGIGLLGLQDHHYVLYRFSFLPPSPQLCDTV